MIGPRRSRLGPCAGVAAGVMNDEIAPGGNRGGRHGPLARHSNIVGEANFAALPNDSGYGISNRSGLRAAPSTSRSRSRSPNPMPWVNTGTVTCRAYRAGRQREHGRRAGLRARPLQLRHQRRADHHEDRRPDRCSTRTGCLRRRFRSRSATSTRRPSRTRRRARPSSASSLATPSSARRERHQRKGQRRRVRREPSRCATPCASVRKPDAADLHRAHELGHDRDVPVDGHRGAGQLCGWRPVLRIVIVDDIAGRGQRPLSGDRHISYGSRIALALKTYLRPTLNLNLSSGAGAVAPTGGPGVRRQRQRHGDPAPGMDPQDGDWEISSRRRTLKARKRPRCP